MTELILYHDKSCVCSYKCFLYRICPYTTTMSLYLSKLEDNNKTYVSGCTYAYM